jgi:hypothetical protein
VLVELGSLIELLQHVCSTGSLLGIAVRHLRKESAGQVPVLTPLHDMEPTHVEGGPSEVQDGQTCTMDVS